MENIIGPIINDKEFYDTLDDSIAEVKETKAAFERGDAKGARHIFAAYARTTIHPEKYYSIPSKTLKPELTDSLKHTAERALRHEMWSCGTPYKYDGKVDWLTNHGINNYCEWPWQLSRHSELNALAEAYRATGDERYAEGCTELFDSWVKQALRPSAEESHGATICWRTIECGIRMGLIWPNIIHTFINTPSWTDDIIVDWFKSVYEHAIRLRTKFSGGNWLIHELDGLANICILYPMFKDTAEWKSTTFKKLVEELKKQIYPDGFQFELATGYHWVVIHHYMTVVEVADAYNVELPPEILKTIEKMIYLYIDLRMSNGQVPDINDGGQENVKQSLAKYFRYFPNNKYFKYFLTDGKEGEAPSYTSKCLPYSGMVTFRTDWELGGVTGFFESAPFGTGHQHEDKLNLLIYANGRPLLCEGNKYAYDTSAMRRYVLSTRAHNTVRINGMDQNRRKSYKAYDGMVNELSTLRFEETASVVYAGGRYDEAYGPAEEKPATHDRTVAFVKAPKVGQPFFAVLDRLTGAKENSYEFIWHYDVKEAALTDFGVKSDYITTFIAGDKGEAKLVSGITEPEVQGWVCRSAIQGSQVAIPTLLYTVTGRDAEVVTVFSVHDGGESPIKAISYDSDADMLTVEYKNGESDTVIL